MYWFILLFPIQKYDYVEHLNSQLQCGIVSSCNEIDLERVQKSALKLILKEKYHNYITALLSLNIESLYDRREQLCLKFAKKSLKLTQFKKMFPLNSMKKRNQNRFIVNNAKTERYMRSSILLCRDF